MQRCLILYCKKNTMALFKGSKLYSIFTGTCPVCHKGKLYQNRNPYILTEALKMNERCSHCKTKYKIEPSFFYGAMYVSYGLGVAVAIAVFITSYFIIGMGRLESFYVIVGTLVILLPIILRLSRNIWINFFFKFDTEKAK